MDSKYKLVCIDLDGTLFSDNKTISNENIQAIRKASNKGVNIAISTGRISKFTQHCIDKLGVDAHIIAANGAIVINNDTNIDKLVHNLSYEKICKLKEITKDYNVNIYLNTEDSIISEGSIYDDYTYKLMNEKLENKYKINILENYTTSNIEQFYKNKIIKAICINKDDIDIVSKVSKILEESNEFEISISDKSFCEINEKGVSKGNAVKYLVEKLAISLEETICIGDSGNDTSMLNVAGMSVAMGNASDEIKSICDYITDTNNNSGVAKAIEKFILK